MRSRCTHTSQHGFANYGGRGITVCERWSSFANFLADMGERPEGKTLDRIDVNGNYEPGNCRWATATEQAANRRDRAPQRITWRGESRTFDAWAKVTGIPASTLYARTNREGWSAEIALTTPSMLGGRRDSRNAAALLALHSTWLATLRLAVHSGKE